MKIAAYVYPGWHPIPERDISFHPGFTEWELIDSCAPRFAGHAQPRLPLFGRYDDRNPVEVARRIALARAHGVDLFVYGFFWCRGKRVFEDALNKGFLDSTEGDSTPFSIMWANRMPRRVLPVRRADLPVIDENRRVSSDVDDFVDLIAHLANHYFGRKNYFQLHGKLYFSVFDSSFFVRELGPENARSAVAAARNWLRDHGYPELHLAAIEPDRGVISHIREIGFDSVTNYVLLPYWKGPFLQDYRETAARRAEEWDAIARAARLPYFPSVSPGWDASPRGADFGPEKPRKYPWWPVVTGEHPDQFHEALRRATAHARATLEEPLVMIASLNEWSEGHYLEPDTRFGTGWLEALAAAK